MQVGCVPCHCVLFVGGGCVVHVIEVAVLLKVTDIKNGIWFRVPYTTECVMCALSCAVHVCWM